MLKFVSKERVFLGTTVVLRPGSGEGGGFLIEIEDSRFSLFPKKNPTLASLYKIIFSSLCIGGIFCFEGKYFGEFIGG